jgi:general secretion pathway protein D
VRRRGSPGLIAVLTALLLVGTSSVALAATLNSVNVAKLPTGGARVTLQFGGGPPPKYTVAGVGTTEASVIFQGVQLGGNVPPSIAGQGPIQAVTVSQVGPNVALSLHLASAVPVRVVPAAGFIIIEVPTGPAHQATDDESDDSTPAAPASTGMGQVTEVIPLKYADVSEIAGVLVQGANVASNDNFNPQTSNFGSQSFGGASNGGENGQPFQQPQFQQGGVFGNQFGNAGQGLAQRINDNLAIDRRLNAVILTGSADVVASLKDVVEKLDVPLDSVLLETQIVELDETGQKDLGIDFNAQGVIAKATLTAQSGQFATSNATFEANLYAQVQRGYGKILARPRILAQNGASASILTGDALPIITTVIVAGTSAVTSQQVNYVNVGVNLQIQPRIASDGYVTSHIFSEVSSVTAYTQGIPQISQRQAQTTATVKDGDSFVIGGLLSDNEVKTTYKIPGLGDIPLIGGLFNRISTTTQKTNLYIVVTPHVIARRSSSAPPATIP